MALPSLKKVARRKPEPEPAPVVLTKPGGKGKLTPTRRQAQAARPVTPYMKTSANPKTGRAGRSERLASTSSTRAVLRGEVSGQLPLRDRAPERGLARQIVDGRRNLTTLVLFIYLIFFATNFLRSNPAIANALFALMLVLLLVVVGDSVLLVRLVGRQVRAAYPGTSVKTGFYSLQRALLPRRFRLPRPGVGVPAAAGR